MTKRAADMPAARFASPESKTQLNPIQRPAAMTVTQASTEA